MTDKQFIRSLQTWKKNNPQIYEEIKMFGSEMDVLGKRGKILKKAKRQDIEQLKKVYEKRYGYYSNFKKKINEELKKEPIEMQKKYKKNIIGFYNLRKNLHESWVELWKTLDSKTAQQVTVTANSMLSKEDKLNLINRVLNNYDRTGKININVEDDNGY